MITEKEHPKLQNINQHEIKYPQSLLTRQNFPRLAGMLDTGIPEGKPEVVRIETEEKDELGNPVFIKALDFINPNDGQLPREIRKRVRKARIITQFDVKTTRDWLKDYSTAHPELVREMYLNGKINTLPEPENVSKNLTILEDLLS